jgi:hypothetical protein
MEGALARGSDGASPSRIPAPLSVMRRQGFRIIGGLYYSLAYYSLFDYSYLTLITPATKILTGPI